ncbi:uncharacterized protein LY89DRAFT_730451 [Mollisia scopiformis]|uniref:Uncharacterized protein n=1 Tax=Mollisia scopiformis TaxID=149040 RepID=A0A194XJW5_MOLSC|nr:uncharacterized protein LY89DRAFT_730451 [Mollisia scopiformis]KUJ20404.1 hypothetical protein LY89DRAFT_730451 [Mollisia scopiformis]
MAQIAPISFTSPLQDDDTEIERAWWNLELQWVEEAEEDGYESSTLDGESDEGETDEDSDEWEDVSESGSEVQQQRNYKMSIQDLTTSPLDLSTITPIMAVQSELHLRGGSSGSDADDERDDTPDTESDDDFYGKYESTGSSSSGSGGSSGHYDVSDADSVASESTGPIYGSS